MNVNLTVDTKGFEAACAALSKVTGKSLQDVLEAEVTTILNQTIVYTKTATKASIDKSNATRAKATFTSQPANLYSPKLRNGIRRGWKGQPVNFSKNGYLRYNLGFRYPTALWAAMQSNRAKDARSRYARIGLAKKSWWVIGMALGLPVKGGRFTNAVGIQQSDFTVSKKVMSDGVQISFVNGQPTINVPFLQGAAKLQSAIDNRTKAFLTNLKKGVFNSMQQIAKQYPGLKLIPK